ncbi:MAG: hypothetical protein VKO65_08575 [Cyanobacteriota bacterium]|nr:hypothetical protein [Cyanobacteriota bacterium]
MSVVSELLLALGLPLLLVLLLGLWLERQQGNLPAWLQRLERRQFWIWNLGIGLILLLNLLRWLLRQ